MKRAATRFGCIGCSSGGGDNVVVDSASIEVSRRQRRAKTDRLDAEALLRRLIRYWLGERDQWKVVQVPSVELEDTRHAERAIATLTAERTRYRSRMHSLLATHGVRVRITARLGERLPLLTNRDGRVLPPGVLARVALAWRMLQASWRRNSDRPAGSSRPTCARRATPAAVRTRRLAQLKGIRMGSAAVLVKEVFARDLRNRRQVGALSGLVRRAVSERRGRARPRHQSRRARRSGA